MQHCHASKCTLEHFVPGAVFAIWNNWLADKTRDAATDHFAQGQVGFVYPRSV